ncbi:endonuclease/exonuclease/phosphatase family protein [Acrocarpospora catenulata]|uniref:endonuclease/exonuclease/phosphatase family protein n=1 Tax=Acrocarpospora catenulata TaxID=2836182 RepID=UPI001BDB1BF8|nr:endonuclease/exonuclease/phosphatase family protein [Acrocarpospora catenulata]
MAPAVLKWPIAALTLGLLLLLDALRVFLPSLITLYGRAGDTPPEQLGLFAALWFVIPFLAIPISRLTGPRAVQVAGAVLLAATRLALQATDGGDPQLYLSAAGVTAGLLFLYGSARTIPRLAAPIGMALGLGLSGLLHLAIDHVDLVWQDGWTPWLPAALVAAAFLWATFRAEAAPSEDTAPAGVWFLLGPALFLAGQSLGPGAAAEDQWIHGAQEQATAATVAALGVACLSLVPFAIAPLLAGAPLRVYRVLFPAGLLVGVFSPLAGVAEATLVAAGVGGCLGLAALRQRTARAGVALLGGAVVFLVATFAYYASYDADLGFPNAVVPMVVGVRMALTGLLGGWHRDSPPLPRPGRSLRTLVPGALALLLVPPVVAAGLTWRTVPAEGRLQGNEFTLVAYNIRMGFGLRGTLDLDRIAAWAASVRPDVVLLSEVDRGWLLNGGHDDLDRIARGLGMRYHFAPAADPLWGDALLTNLPVSQVVSHRLGQHDYPTGAQAQTAVLTVGDREVGIVNTHLQAPAGQAPEVAELVRRLGAGRPVVLAGDLNTSKEDPEMRVLEGAGLTDPLIALGDPPTSPADDPVKRIDHVLVTQGLTVVSAEVPRVPYSDHLPVVVQLRVG